MFDREFVLEILEQILEASLRVLKRFEPIRSVDDFTNSESGMEKLDAICMQLVAIGESLKNLDKITGNELLTRYPEIEWKKNELPRRRAAGYLQRHCNAASGWELNPCPPPAD